ncbi:hypothetical protein AAKU55_005367 [Oxalobacteraceae bacterium GrIS 1.11]
MNLYFNRNFVLTYAASFISLFGSKLLMMSYLAYIFEARGSATLASAVLAAEWGTCLVVGLFVSRYIDGMSAKRLLVGLNVLAAAVTMVFVTVIQPQLYPFAIAVIVVRALLSHSVNSTRIKALVQFFSKEETTLFSPVFNSSLFIATAVAGAVGVYILKFVTLTTVVYIDAATFLIASGLFLFVNPNPERLAESIAAARDSEKGRLAYIRSAFGIIKANPKLASAVFYIILSVTSFQATYNVLMTVAPQIWFGLGKSGTALFFTFESVFVTAGVFLYQFLNRRGLINDDNQRGLNLATVAFSTSVYLFIPQLQHNLLLCMVVLNTMVLSFELIWTHQFKQMIANIPPSKIAAVTGLQMAIGYSLMGVFAFAFSTGIDHFGISTTIYLNASLLVLLVAGWEYLTRNWVLVAMGTAS